MSGQFVSVLVLPDNNFHTCQNNKSEIFLWNGTKCFFFLIYNIHVLFFWKKKLLFRNYKINQKHTYLSKVCKRNFCYELSTNSPLQIYLHPFLQNCARIGGLTKISWYDWFNTHEKDLFISWNYVLKSHMGISISIWT